MVLVYGRRQRMEIAVYEGKTINILSELNELNDIDIKSVLEKYKKIAEKGAMTCPFCNEKMILRAGQKRDIHFSHLRGNTCMESTAYDTYQGQVSRENKKHSVIKEIIYDELKTQEKIKANLKVEYGYKEKANEKWRYYPDIYLNRNGVEFAVSVITNVNVIGDKKVISSIQKRNKYFEEKGLQIIWFVEDRELADDFTNRVVHLWETEYNLAIKTLEDSKWDSFISELAKEYSNNNIPGLFGYKKRSSRLKIDVRSIYYVHSVGDEITCSVHRVILDEKTSPFRSFAVNKGYQVSISQALIVHDEIQLCDEEIENKERLVFLHEFELKLNGRLQTSDTESSFKKSNFAAASGNNEKPRVEEPTVEVSLDVIEYIEKLHYCSINAVEAKGLYQYLRVHKDELMDYGITLDQIKKAVGYALGRISDPKIRTWLVEIEYL